MVAVALDEDVSYVEEPALDRMVRIETESGSTYIVGPGDGPAMRVARVSDHAVRGTGGPLAFADDFVRVGFVSNGRALLLECTQADGTAFRTSPIREVANHVPEEATAGATTRSA